MDEWKVFLLLSGISHLRLAVTWVEGTRRLRSEVVLLLLPYNSPTNLEVPCHVTLPSRRSKSLGLILAISEMLTCTMVVIVILLTEDRSMHHHRLDDESNSMSDTHHTPVTLEKGKGMNGRGESDPEQLLDPIHEDHRHDYPITVKEAIILRRESRLIHEITCGMARAPKLSLIDIISLIHDMTLDKVIAWTVLVVLHLFEKIQERTHLLRPRLVVPPPRESRRRMSRGRHRKKQRMRAPNLPAKSRQVQTVMVRERSACMLCLLPIPRDEPLMRVSY
jgi:hypothetical protein